MYRIALLSDTAAQDMIPSLSLLSHKVHVFPLDTAHTALETETFDLLMVDARTALVKARHCAQLLRAAGVQLPLIALLNEGGMAAVAASWQVDDIVSDQASPLRNGCASAPRHQERCRRRRRKLRGAHRARGQPHH